jgi:hypothetical protein
MDRAHEAIGRLSTEMQQQPISAFMAELSARVSDLERAQQKSLARTRRGTVDPRHVYIAVLKAENPQITGRAICMSLDKAAERQEQVRPRAEWTAATGLRTWLELWDARNHPKTQAAVKKYVHAVRAFSAH